MSNPIIRTPKDKALLEKWNKKLDKYDDCNAEDMSFDEPKLRVWHNFKWKKLGQNEYEARLKYFNNCSSILHNYRFENTLHKRIWELHTEGMSLRDIEKAIKFRYKKDTINQIIHWIETNATSKDSDSTGTEK